MSVYTIECGSSKTKKTTDTQNNMGETQKHFVLWKKNQDTHNSIYTKFKKTHTVLPKSKVVISMWVGYMALLAKAIG